MALHLVYLLVGMLVGIVLSSWLTWELDEEDIT